MRLSCQMLSHNANSFKYLVYVYYMNIICMYNKPGLGSGWSLPDLKENGWNPTVKN